MKKQNFRRRLHYAWTGLRFAGLAEASFRTQLVCAVLTLIGMLILHPAPIWWALVALAVGSVLAAELANTALEKALDRLHPERHELIGLAKDAAAASVLVLSVAAVLVALCVVIDRWDIVLADANWLLGFLREA